MARFYGEVQGTRGRASRLGSAGMRSHTRGWNVGVEVVCTIRDDVDVIEVYETGGSHAPGAKRLIATVTDRK
ncbi:MAG TPA: hypothetical protein VGF28_27355 [Thermoanaerobaculia bacterium]|jgi:hypothetical protein